MCVCVCVCISVSFVYHPISLCFEILPSHTDISLWSVCCFIGWCAWSAAACTIFVRYVVVMLSTHTGIKIDTKMPIPSQLPLTNCFTCKFLNKNVFRRKKHMLKPKFCTPHLMCACVFSSLFLRFISFVLSFFNFSFKILPCDGNYDYQFFIFIFHWMVMLI